MSFPYASSRTKEKNTRPELTWIPGVPRGYAMIHRLSHGNDRFKSGKYTSPKRYGDDQGNAGTVRTTGIILANNRLRTTNCRGQCASPGQLKNVALGCDVVLVPENRSIL